jgi:hypothetical protein
MASARVLLAVATAASASLLSACGGRLLVYDSQSNPVIGVPVRMAETYVKHGTHYLLAKGGDCEPADFFEIASIPTGERFYVAADPGYFLKTGFHVKFSENGALSEVGLDTEPAAADTLKAIGELYKALTPAPAASATASMAPGTKKLAACDAGERNVTFTRFDELKGATGKR